MASLLEALAPAFWKWVAEQLRPYWPPPRPGALSVRLLRGENPMLVYGVTLPAPGDATVVTRELSQVVNGGTPTVVTLKVGDPDPEVKVADKDDVVLTLVDVDAVGNKSIPSPELHFVAADTIPPAAPGALSVKLLREEP